MEDHIVDVRIGALQQRIIPFFRQLEPDLQDYRQTCQFLADKAADGRTIPQMMFNSQQADGSWFGNGGDGWIRILEFRPDGKTIGVRTFSPLFALSPRTSHLAWRTADYDNFEIVIEKLPEQTEK